MIIGPEINCHLPLAVTVKRASELSGLGLTSIWSFIRDGRLEAVRLPGIRRTLVSYESLARLLSPPVASVLNSRRRGRPRKTPLRLQEENTSN